MANGCQPIILYKGIGKYGVGTEPMRILNKLTCDVRGHKEELDPFRIKKQRIYEVFSIEESCTGLDVTILLSFCYLVSISLQYCSFVWYICTCHTWMTFQLTRYTRLGKLCSISKFQESN